VSASLIVRRIDALAIARAEPTLEVAHTPGSVPSACARVAVGAFFRRFLALPQTFALQQLAMVLAAGHFVTGCRAPARA